MNLTKLMIFLTFVTFSTNTFSYGSGSSSKKACKKPKFSQFTPPHLSVVKPQSEFSFIASSSTNPKSIAVSIKNHDIETNINKTRSGYTVTGSLPSAFQGEHARVKIKAKGTNKCPATDGWLLKIEE